MQSQNMFGGGGGPSLIWCSTTGLSYDTATLGKTHCVLFEKREKRQRSKEEDALKKSDEGGRTCEWPKLWGHRLRTSQLGKTLGPV